MASAMRLAIFDICNGDFAVQVMLTRYIKTDCDCNCNFCTKIYESSYNRGVTFSKANTYPP